MKLHSQINPLSPAQLIIPPAVLARLFMKEQLRIIPFGLRVSIAPLFSALLFMKIHLVKFELSPFQFNAPPLPIIAVLLSNIHSVIKPFATLE